MVYGRGQLFSLDRSPAFWSGGLLTPGILVCIKMKSSKAQTRSVGCETKVKPANSAPDLHTMYFLRYDTLTTFYHVIIGTKIEQQNDILLSALFFTEIVAGIDFYPPGSCWFSVMSNQQ